MSFGERLRLARKAKDMSQQELADKLGISVNSIANYERGTSFPKEDYLYKIMSIFDLDPNYLFQDELGMNSGLWIEENNLLNKYRMLDKRDRSVVNSLVAKSIEKTIISRLAVKDRELNMLCITVKNHVYGLFRYADALDVSKMSSAKENVDFSVMIKGKGLEPAYINGTVLGFKYTQEIKDSQIGLYEIGGYAVIATKKGRRLINAAAKDIAADFYGIKPILLGRLVEVHISE